MPPYPHAAELSRNPNGEGTRGDFAMSTRSFYHQPILELEEQRSFNVFCSSLLSRAGWSHTASEKDREEKERKTPLRLTAAVNIWKQKACGLPTPRGRVQPLSYGSLTPMSPLSRSYFASSQLSALAGRRALSPLPVEMCPCSLP